MRVIEAIRSKVRKGDYELTIPHFLEELAADGLVLVDVERAVANGRVARTFTRDSRGRRYEVIGTATDGRPVGIVCRMKVTGTLLFITVYALE